MHLPVLKKEVLEYLNPQPNENFIDATLGLGGHTKAIFLRNGPKGKVLGIEIDSEICEKVRREIATSHSQFSKRLILVNDSYINLKKIVKKYNFEKVKGVLFDLGMSSWCLEKSGRGFSFLKDEPLDMRYSRKFPNELTAKKIVNEYSQEEIEKILREYGEERFARRIAERIIQKRKIKPIESTLQLVEIIKEALPRRYKPQKIHFATRTFQALRIAVNDELNNLRKALLQALEILEGKGRLVVISFHSLEDRIVKNFFKAEEKKKLKILTKKPVRPSPEEIKMNPRSRSAKLRAAIKLAS